MSTVMNDEKDIRARLRTIEADLSAARGTRAAARQARDTARQRFAQAKDQSPKAAPYRQAMQAVDALTEAEQNLEQLQEAQNGVLRMLGGNQRAARDGNGPRSGDGPAGDGWRYAARELDLSAGRNRVDMPARDLMAAVTVTPSSSLSGPSLHTPFVPQAQDSRFLYPLLPHTPVDPGVLALTEFKQTSRTLSGEVERDPVATGTKADLALAVELATPRLKQFAVTISGVPQQLFESVEVFYSWLKYEAAYQLNLALDAHVLAQIEAATPAHGKTGATMIEKARNAVAAMRALGANPSILVFSPTDAAALDVQKVGEYAYIFPTGATGASSPLYGMQVVENPRATTPLLIDPHLLGLLYSEMGTLLVDPFSSLEKNLVRLRVEFTGLYHVRDAAGAYSIS